MNKFSSRNQQSTNLNKMFSPSQIGENTEKEVPHYTDT